MQNAAAMMTPDDFLIRLAHKYGLYQFWKHGYVANGEATAELSKHSVAVAEEFLAMVIIVIGTVVNRRLRMCHDFSGTI